MATTHGSRPSAVVPGFRDPGAARIDVYQLYRDQMQCLAGLPGQVSEFQQNQFGYEWRCEFELDATGELQLQFSLVDLQDSRRPAAVLYLVDSQQRTSLFLEDLNAAHEQLNAELAQRGASIDTLEKSHVFISALANVRETLGDALSWD